MELGLSGKTALVTASSRGIGKAIAVGLAEEGCQVIICSRNRDCLFQTAKEIETNTHQAVIPVPVDLSQKESIAQFVTTIEAKFKTVDILINNTGGPSYRSYEDLTDQDWQDTFDLTFLSQIKISQFFIPMMKQQNWGRIIFVTSAAIKQPGALVANAQRASVAVYAKTLANELGKYNILINTICPSLTVTERYYQWADTLAKRKNTSREKILEGWMKSIPLHRPGTPEEVANLAVFLASEKASYMTGNCIQVDGGLISNLF